jgi:predicted DNA-binding transcriptional regulator AlpA
VETTLAETDGRKVVKTAEQKRAARQQRITNTLARWDSLPDDAHVRVVTVAALFDCSVPTIWRWAKVGILPKPHKVSAQMTAWKVGEVRAARRDMLAKTAA